MYDFLQQQSAPDGHLGQDDPDPRISFGGMSRFGFGSRFFPFRFNFPFQFPFFFPQVLPYAQQYPYPYAYPYPTPPALPQVNVTINGQAVSTSQAGLDAALAVLNASTGSVYVTVTVNGQTVLTKSVAAGVPEAALATMRAAMAAAPQYPQSPGYGGYGGYGMPYGLPPSVWPWWRGILYGTPEEAIAAGMAPGELGMPSALPQVPPHPYPELPPAPYPQLPPGP